VYSEDFNVIEIRLTDILGIITLVVLVSLVLDYQGALKKKARLGLLIGLMVILTGFFLTLGAVLPGNHFYGTVYSHGSLAQKTVALTFDDGPYPPYTDKILDILKEKNIKATFFLVGQNAAKYPEIVQRIFADGHQLGNHTYTHKDLLKTDAATVAAEIEKTNKLIYNLTGYNTHIFRPPHGFKDRVILNIIMAQNLKAIDWSVAGRDWGSNARAEDIFKRVVTNVQNGSIILLHDGHAPDESESRTETVKATAKNISSFHAVAFSS
jgi:peptidoglycan/xylan/chitin deacetylase (PgdA/CDA1 family)